MKFRLLTMKVFTVLIIGSCFSLLSAIHSVSDELPSELKDSQSGSGDIGFESFRIIHQRNVFDPNRRKPIPLSERRRDKPAPVRTASFTLQGTMSYRSRSIAFFNGSESDYRRSVEINDVIGSHRIVEIKPDEVVMELDGKRIHLPVRHSRKRRGEEAWMDSKEGSGFSSGASDSGYRQKSSSHDRQSGDSNSSSLQQTSESSATDAGTKSVLQLMMEKRKREMEK